jgi:hypothetical protein
MRNRRPYFAIILGIFSLFCSYNSMAQLQQPGKIRGDFRQMKAADIMYVLPPVDPLEVEASKLQNLNSAKKPLKFALERPLQLSPDTHGNWIEQDGIRIWRIHLLSPGALSMGLVFNQFQLEPGVDLMIYDPDRKHVRGAFTSFNNKTSGVLPVGHIPGSELILELQVPNDMTDFGSLNLESLSHAFLPAALPGAKKDGRFGRSQDCEIDINCSEGNDWQLSKKSVVRIYTSTQYCTGVLVNNTSYDGTPYVLTSEHCINKPFYADRSVFVFDYESDGCYGGDGSVAKSIAGCDTMAVGDSVDFSLVRLSSVPPDSFEAYYTGWDLDDAQNSSNTCIHHPEGDVKKISFDFDPVTTPAAAGDIAPGDLRDYFYFSYWWVQQWDIGTTEGGSSGSPLFNSGKRLIGILTGGYAKCGDSIGYDAEKDRIIYNLALNKDDYYTKFNVAWDFYGEAGPALKPWLDPGNTGAITIGGYLPSSVPETPVIENNNFNIFPNPASDLIQIQTLGRLNHFSPVVLRLFDVKGSSHLNGTFSSGDSYTLELSSLQPGLYFIEIEMEGIREYHKVIVTRE